MTDEAQIAQPAPTAPKKTQPATPPVFEPPADVNALIWRYLDFTKFVDLLDTRALFFTRADHFEDRFEGSYPRLNVSSRADSFTKRGASEHDAKVLAQKVSFLSKEFRRYMAINCWHMNPYESAAMWRLYLKSNEGIAVQSSYSRLMASFLPSNEQINVGVVRYIDYDIERAPEGNLFYPFLHKRKSFEHEHELRAIVHKQPPSLDNHRYDFARDSIAEGIRVPVDVETLISKVFVAPDSPGWLTTLVRSVAKKYSITAAVVQSSLAKDPIF